MAGAPAPNHLPAIDVLLETARRDLDRVEPAALAAEMAAGALVVDTRPIDQRRRDGDLPGAVIIDRNVLEWRLDPVGDWRLPGFDAGTTVVVVCNEGWASSLAARDLQRIGLANATDLVGGYRGWRAAGLPIREGGSQAVV